MKKILIILILVFFAVSCATIDQRYTEKRIKVSPQEQEYEEYSSAGASPYYYGYGYSPYYYSPFYWVGFYWWSPYLFWDPFFYYGFYNFYYGYYPGYYGRYYGGYYPGYWGTRYGRSVIWKKQLKKGTLRTIPKSRVKNISGKAGSTGRIRSTISRSGTSIRTTVSSTSRVSSTKIKKKN